MSGRRDAGPVAPTDRVSDVLARDEALVEVFVRASPHFAKLRNRALRRVMARLVTVGDAARIAGLDPAELAGRLDAALGLARAEPGPAGSGGPAAAHAAGPAPAEPPAHPATASVVEVDVREDLRSGREPFSRIMAAVLEVGPGQVLRLRATFEPAPLYAVLGKRGFLHETQNDGPEDWSVWFWRPEDAGVPVAAPAPAPPAAAEPAPDTLRLDVRGLEPPEPMVRTLEVLETLPAGRTLVQVNARVPQFLLPILAERGFAWEVDETPADHVLVRIRRRG